MKSTTENIVCRFVIIDLLVMNYPLLILAIDFPLLII